VSAKELANLDVTATVANIAAATLGNVIGGALLVGLVYWFVYLRPMPHSRVEGDGRPGGGSGRLR
jgi:formate/nitrite transporter FocA (FNT family)